MGTATCQLGYLIDWQLCGRRSCRRPNVVPLELHFKVSGGKKKRREKKRRVIYSGRNDAGLAFVHDCTSLTNPDTKNLWDCSYTSKFEAKKKDKKKKSHLLWQKWRCSGILYMIARLSPIQTRKKCVVLQTFVSFEIVARVCTFAENKVDPVFDA